MNIPDKGRVLEAPPTGTGETSENVTLARDTSKNITSSPKSYNKSYKYLTDSLKHGSKTEQLLACFMTYDHVSKTIAKQVYGETRLQQRVTDLTAKGFDVGRNYSRPENRGLPKATYYLPEQSIPAAQTRINELRVFRKAEPINWEAIA